MATAALIHHQHPWAHAHHQHQHHHHLNSSSSSSTSTATAAALVATPPGAGAAGVAAPGARKEIPKRNEVPFNREGLIPILEFFSQCVGAAFNNRQIRLVVHGGACMLLHDMLHRLSTQQHQLHPTLPHRTSTRDVDYIHRSFLTEMAQQGVLDAEAKIKDCIRRTAETCGLGLDWMNSDADVALPFIPGPNGTRLDPIYHASIQSNNINLHTIFRSKNGLLTLISVTPFWAVSLKLVRYTPQDAADICLLLRNGTLLSQTKWSFQTLKSWLILNCSAMGYASYGSAQMAKLDNQLTHAVQMVCEWGNHVSAGNPNDAVGGGVGGGSGAVTGLWIGGQFKAGPVEHVMDGVNAGSPGSGNAGASSNGNVDMPVTPLMTAMGGGHEVLGSDYASGARGWNGSAWTGAGVTPGWTGATASQPAHPTGVNGSNRMSISSSVGETTFDPVEHQRQVQLQQHQHQHQHQHQQHQHQQRQQQQQQYSSAPALTMSPWLPAGHNAHQSHPPRREGSSRTRTPTPPIPIHLFDFSLASDKERAFMENRDHHARVYSQGGVPGSATGSPASGTGANTKGPGHGHDHRHSQTTAVMPMGDRTNRLGGGGNGNGRGAASANDRSGGMMSLGMSEMANSLDDILNAPYAAVGGAAHVGPGNSALMGIGMGPAGISGVNALGLNSLSTIGKREREKERAKQKERSNKGQKTTRGRDKKAKEKKKDKERRRERMDAEWVDARRSDYPDVALAIAGRDGLSSSAPVGVYPYSYGAQASGSSHHQRPSTSGGFRQNGTVDESESESEDSEDDDTDADDGQPHSHSQSQLQGRSWFGTGFGTQGSPGHTPALVPSRLQPQPHSEGYAHAPQQQPSMPQIQYQHQLMHQSGSQQLQQHRSHTLPTLPTYMQSQHVPSVPHRASTMPTIGTTVSIPPIPRFPEPTIPPVPPPLPPNEEESDDSDSEDEEADDAEAFIPPLDDFGAPPGAAMQGHQGGHHALHSQQAPSPQAHHPHAHQQQQHYQQGMQYRHPHQHQMYHPYPPSTYPQQQRQT